ncbi:HD domain-containing protein [Bifidobacterium miconisargentati]|uniref:HD domain-containing protein n=1 Tax=Bifidobacterium miconisargentati TaxID=2834437 RepID=UPI001BDCE5D2|nr:HD domain-containing protein [Bifidobacterium miconisargentati]MBW3091176.1 HD domain-containing protein [Bifidobacterium miconisargentati]
MSGYIPTVQQIDELHRKIAPSEEAYELVHTHCVIVATIACQIVRRQNALFTRRCTLPKDAPEWGDRAVTTAATTTTAAGNDAAARDAGQSDATATSSPSAPAYLVPPTAGVTGGHVPPRLLDEHLVLIGGLLHDIGTYKVFKHDGTDGEPLKFSGKKYILHGLKGYKYLLKEGVDESIAQFCRNHTGVGLTREDVIRQDLPLPPDDYVPMNLEQEVVMYADKFHSKSVPPKFLTVDAYTKRAERYGEENKERWLDLVAKYGVPDIPALAEKYQMRLI